MPSKDTILQLKQRIKEWEYDFYKQNDRLPSKLDIKKDKVYKLYKTYNHVKKEKGKEDVKDISRDVSRDVSRDISSETSSDEEFSFTQLGPTPQSKGKILSILDMQLTPPHSSPLKRKSRGVGLTRVDEVSLNGSEPESGDESLKFGRGSVSGEMANSSLGSVSIAKSGLGSLQLTDLQSENRRVVSLSASPTKTSGLPLIDTMRTPTKSRLSRIQSRSLHDDSQSLTTEVLQSPQKLVQTPLYLKRGESFKILESPTGGVFDTPVRSSARPQSYLSKIDSHNEALTYKMENGVLDTQSLVLTPAYLKRGDSFKIVESPIKSGSDVLETPVKSIPSYLSRIDSYNEANSPSKVDPPSCLLEVNSHNEVLASPSKITSSLSRFNSINDDPKDNNPIAFSKSPSKPPSKSPSKSPYFARNKDSNSPFLTRINEINDSTDLSNRMRLTASMNTFTPVTPTKPQILNFLVSPSPLKLHRFMNKKLSEVFNEFKLMKEEINEHEFEIEEVDKSDDNDGLQDDETVVKKKSAKTQKRTTRRYKIKPRESVNNGTDKLNNKNIHKEMKKIETETIKTLTNLGNDEDEEEGPSDSDEEYHHQDQTMTKGMRKPTSNNFKRLKINDPRTKKFKQRMRR